MRCIVLKGLKMSPRQENIFFLYEGWAIDRRGLILFFYDSYDPARSGYEVGSTHKNVKKRDFAAPTGSVVV